MEADNKTGFAVHDKPYVIFDSGNFNHCFISMPLVRIEVEKRQELDSHIIEQRGKACTPIADSNMRNLDIKGRSKNKADITEGVFAEIEHGKCCDYEMNGITHSLEIALSKQ